MTVLEFTTWLVLGSCWTSEAEISIMTLGNIDSFKLRAKTIIWVCVLLYSASQKAGSIHDENAFDGCLPISQWRGMSCFLLQRSTRTILSTFFMQSNNLAAGSLRLVNAEAIRLANCKSGCFYNSPMWIRKDKIIHFSLSMTCNSLQPNEPIFLKF